MDVRIVAVAGFCAVLAGCGTQPVAVRTERVEVPIPVPCRIAPIERPTWALDALPADADLFQRVQAMAVEIEQRRAYIERLESAVRACQ